MKRDIANIRILVGRNKTRLIPVKGFVSEKIPVGVSRCAGVDGGAWVLTHLDSGYSLGLMFGRLKHAKRAAGMLEDLSEKMGIDWASVQESEVLWIVKDIEKIAAAIQEIRRKVKQ